MRLHWLQHVPFEGLGSISSWASERNLQTTCTRLFAGDRMPEVGDLDFLVVMGGPMGVSDELEYPWLTSEKAFIKTAIGAGKKVFGICLGAQLIADAMGAGVNAGRYKEIGWHTIRRVADADSVLPKDIPDQFQCFHWHGDTFDIPEGAVRLFESDACRNQGFIWREQVFALQFHLETTPDSAEHLVANCRHELTPGAYVQTAEEILRPSAPYAQINKLMTSLLEWLWSRDVRRGRVGREPA